MRAERDDGSALMLMPAMVLVLIVLAAICVDSAIIFLGERELAAAVAAAANDASVAGIDRTAFYRCGELRADARAMEEIATQSLANRAADAVKLVDLEVRVDDAVEGPRVTVAATAQVDLLFSSGVPGGPDAAAVDAVSVATARSPDRDPAVADGCGG